MFWQNKTAHAGLPVGGLLDEEWFDDYIVCSACPESIARENDRAQIQEQDRQNMADMIVVNITALAGYPE